MSLQHHCMSYILYKTGIIKQTNFLTVVKTCSELCRASMSDLWLTGCMPCQKFGTLGGNLQMWLNKYPSKTLTMNFFWGEISQFCLLVSKHVNFMCVYLDTYILYMYVHICMLYYYVDICIATLIDVLVTS